MDIRDSYTGMNHLQSVRGIKATGGLEAVPLYIKLCKLKRATRNLSEEDVKYLNECGLVYFYRDEKELQEKIENIQDRIMHTSKDNETIVKAFHILDTEFEVLKAIKLLL